MYAASDVPPDRSQKPMVLVHPYFKWRKATLDQFDLSPESLDQNGRSYLEQLSNHLIHFTGPLIVLEGRLSIPKTLDRLVTLRGKEGINVIQTYGGGYGPNEISTKDAVDFIASFTGDEVDFAGGRYNPGESRPGCLGGFIKEFERYSSKRANILDGLTFV